jgi:hypothetical protein
VGGGPPDEFPSESIVLSVRNAAIAPCASAPKAGGPAVNRFESTSDDSQARAGPEKALPGSGAL